MLLQQHYAIPHDAWDRLPDENTTVVKIVPASTQEPRGSGEDTVRGWHAAGDMTT